LIEVLPKAGRFQNGGYGDIMKMDNLCGFDEDDVGWQVIQGECLVLVHCHDAQS
jgi:hypothetical protein